MESGIGPARSGKTFLSEDLSSRMKAWRQDLHRHPELGFTETRTAGFVANELRAAGIEVHEGIGGTGLVGVLRRGTGNRGIGIRADMDALPITEQNDFDHRSGEPGVMHACGHDGHTTMLLGAAAHLAAHGNFDGTAVFIFQPDEENGRGARAMIDDGLFDRLPVDAVYGLHNLPGLEEGRVAVRSGPVMACEDTFQISISGKGTHAAMPHKGIDPIVAGAQVIMALQTIVSRQMNPLDDAVVSVTDFRTNGVRNVIPGEVTITGDARSFTPEVSAMIETTMKRIVSGLCEASGTMSTVEYDREFTATINSAREADVVARVAADVAGAGSVDPDCAPLMASDDFGAMLEHRPGAYFFLGNGTDGAHGHALHNPAYDFNDGILVRGAELWVRLVETQLAA